MERLPKYTRSAGILRGLALFSMAAGLLQGTVCLADAPSPDEAAAIEPIVSELFSEPVAAEPEDVQPVAAEPPISVTAQPTPVVKPAAASEKSVPTPQTLWQDRPIGNLKATLDYSKGDLPPNQAAPRIAEAALMGDTFGDIRPWVLSNCEWEAPATRHLPLLFEEPNLERMGYTHHCRPGRCEERSRPRMAECMQPLVSGVHFAGNLAMIPYRCGYQPLCEPVYTLGADRPGSPVCYRKHETPLSLRGSLYQAGFITGLVFLIP